MEMEIVKLIGGLLGACEYALERLELANDDKFDPDGMNRLRAAVAKARGETLALVGGSIAPASALDDLANDVKLQTPALTGKGT